MQVACSWRCRPAHVQLIVCTCPATLYTSCVTGVRHATRGPVPVGAAEPAADRLDDALQRRRMGDGGEAGVRR